MALGRAQKKLPNRELIRTNVRIDENTYNRFVKLKLETRHSINTLMKMAFDYFLDFKERGR